MLAYRLLYHPSELSPMYYPHSQPASELTRSVMSGYCASKLELCRNQISIWQMRVFQVDKRILRPIPVVGISWVADFNT